MISKQVPEETALASRPIGPREGLGWGKKFSAAPTCATTSIDNDVHTAPPWRVSSQEPDKKLRLNDSLRLLNTLVTLHFNYNEYTIQFH